MPSRILREGILTSPRMAKLGWAEEVFYRRLHSVVDDFGRYYADPGMLRAACYPRQLGKVSDSDIGKWLQCIADAGLVRVYPAQDGERYLEVLDFGQQVRAKKSKFPGVLGTCVADAEQPQANAPVFVSVDVVESVVPAAPPVGVQVPEWMPAQEWADFIAHRKAMRGVPFTDAARKGVIRDLEKLKAKGHDPATLLSRAVTNGWRTVFEPKVSLANPADVARVTVPGPGPSPFLAEQAAHRAAVEAERIARKQRQAA